MNPSLNGAPVGVAAASLTPLPVVPDAPLAALVPLELLVADVALVELLVAVVVAVVVAVPLVPVELVDFELDPHPPATNAITPTMLANATIVFRPPRSITAAPPPRAGIGHARPSLLAHAGVRPVMRRGSEPLPAPQRPTVAYRSVVCHQPDGRVPAAAIEEGR